MGTKLVRGETIYFVRHGGPNSAEMDPSFWDDIDGRLLPRIYTRSGGHTEPPLFPSVIPIEIQTFKAS
jgi:hypothetical protein